MSWLESVQNQLIITTGDGKPFKPFWKNNCVKEIEYNIAQFDFPKIAGSLINRGTPTARKFSLDIVFQGDDHLEEALAFEVSAGDPRPWNIIHPIYGNILVQPVGLKFDYSAFNITQITGTVIETLGSAGLKIVIVPIDKIIADKSELDDVAVQSYNALNELMIARERTASDIGFSSQQVDTLKGLNKILYDIGVKAVKLTEDASTYLNAFNAANASIDQFLTLPGLAMQTLQSVINFPGLMVTSINVRMDVLSAQLDSLGNQVSVISSVADKKNYETIGAGLVSSMSIAAIVSYDSNNEAVTTGLLPDYQTRADVLAIIALIQELYNTYLALLDTLQSDNGGTGTSYIPDADSLTGLDELIKFTIENLYSIALSSKQERAIVLNEDSNLIILAHRFYGLLADDSTIITLMKNNNICLNEILQIKKGRTMIYYI